MSQAAAAVKQGQQEYLEFVVKLKLQEMQQGLEKMVSDVKASDQRTKAEFDKINRNIAGLGKTATDTAKTWSSRLKDMQGAVTGFTVASAASFAALTVTINDSARTFGDFQAQVNTLQAVSGASAAQLAELEAKAMKLGATTKFSASQMAQAQVEMAKLGFTSSEIMDALDGVVAAASASGAGLADAGELIAGTVRGFGLAAGDATFVADVLAKAANISALGFEDLALSMKYVAPIAAASGQKLTDMVGIMAVLSNNMIKSETAGTALRGIMSGLQNPSNDAAKTMKRLGVEVATAEGKIKPLPKIFAELQKELVKYSQADQNKALAELFGTEALSAASVMIKTTTEELGKFTGALVDATGSSKATTDIMNQGLNAELAELDSAVEGLKIQFGKELSPALERVIELLTDMLGWVSKLPGPVKKTAAEVALLSLAMTGVATGLGAMALAGGPAIQMINGLRNAALLAYPALAPLLGPLGLIAGGAIAGGTAALIYKNNLFAEENQKGQEAEDAARLGGGSLKGVKALAKVRNEGIVGAGKLDPGTVREAAVQAQQEATTARNNIRTMQGLLSDLQKVEIEISDRAAGAVPTALENRRRELMDSIQNYGATSSAELAGVIRKTQQEADKLEQESKTFAAVADEAKKRAEQNKTAPKPTEKLAEEGGGSKTGKASEIIQRINAQTEKAIAKDKERLALTTKTNAAVINSTENQIKMGQKVAETAVSQVEKYSRGVFIETEKLGTQCLRGVYGTLLEVDKQLGTGMAKALEHLNAYEAIPSMMKSKYFKEIEWDGKSKLPAGTVVAWEKGTSPSGHISIADGQGGELSDKKRQQMGSHYGGGKPRAFAVVPDKAIADSAEQQKAKEAQIEQTRLQEKINSLKAEAAKLDRNSATYAKDYADLMAEVGKTETQLIEKRTDGIKANQEAEKKAIEDRKAAFEKLEQEIFTKRQETAQSIYELQKRLDQQYMSDFERMQDDFNREIDQRQTDLNQLKVLAATANVDEAQRKMLVEQISQAEAEIARLKGVQAKATARGQVEDDKRAAALFEALAAEYADETLAAERESLEVRRDSLSEREKELQLAIQLGQLSPEGANAESLALLRERIKLKSEEVGIAQRDLEASNGDNRQANQERLNQLQGEQNDLLRDQKRLLGEAQQLIEQKAQVSLQQSNQALMGMLSTTGSLVAGMSALGQRTGEMVNSLKSGLAIANQFTEILGKETANRVNMMRGAVNSGKAKGPVGAQAAAGGGMSDASASGLIGGAMQGGEMYWGFINNVMGAATPQAITELQNAQKQHLLDMEQLDIQVMQKRLERKRRDGAATAELYAEEKALAEKQAAASIKAKELEVERLKASSNSILGLFRSPQDEQRIKQAEQQLAAFRLNVEENLQADLRDLDLARWTDAEQRAREYVQRIEGIRLDIASQQASRTVDPLDDIEAARNSAKSNSLRNFQAGMADIMNRYGNRAMSPEAVAERSALIDKFLDDQKQADFEASQARRRLAEQDTQFFEQTQNAARLAQIEVITQVDHRERQLIQERGRQALANIDAQLNAEGISDTRRRALQQERLTTEQRITREVVMQAEAALRREENGARALKRAQAQGTQTQTDDILADYEDTLAALAEEERKAYRELSGVELDNTLKTIMQKRLNAEKETQRRMRETIANEYKERLDQQRTLLQENLDLERRQWDDLIRTKEQQADAINARIRQMEEDLEQKRRERDRQLEAFNPDDMVQSAQFRADLAALDTDALAWQGVDSLSNVANVGGLPNVSGETKRMGLLEEADLLEKKASNDLKRELIDREAYIKLMQQAQLVRVKAAEEELATDQLTRRRQLELEEEWANAYTRYQELAREAINARYEAQEKGAQKALQAEQDGLKAVQAEIEGYQAKIKALEESAQKDLRIVEDAIKQAERSTREWAGAWSNVAEEAKKAMAAMQAAQARGASSIPTGMQVVTPRGSSATKTTAYSVAGPDGLYYATTSEMRAANGLAKGGFIADSSRYEGDKAGPFWLDRKEAVVPFDKWPEILRPFMPTAPQAQSMVFAPQISFPHANFSTDVDVRGVVNEILDEQRRDFARSVGQFA